MSKKASRSQRKMSKKEQRREQVAKEKRMRYLKIAVPILAVIAVLGGILLARSLRPEVEGATVVASALGNQHDEDLTFVGGGLPPMGGPHNPSWLNCGIYDQPVPAENAVHSMEHGAVWVTYHPEIDEAEIAMLTDAARGDGLLILSPYPDQDSPIVLTTWDRQLALETAVDERYDEFMSRYRGLRGPEAGASCTGGVGTPVG